MTGAWWRRPRSRPGTAAAIADPGRRDALARVVRWPAATVATALVTAPTGARAATEAAAGPQPVEADFSAGQGKDLDAPFSFAFIGDMPYGRFETGLLQDIFDGLPARDLAFLVHVGDLKSRLESFGDDFLAQRLALLDRSPLPLVYTPGDNDWADCPVPRAGGWDDDRGPGGRLRWLRAHAFGADRALGRGKLAVTRQGDVTADATAAEPRLPENLRWRVGGVRFCTLHVVGSDDGLEGLSGRDYRPAFDAWAARQQANARWLLDCVELARNEDARALAIALHANLRFDRTRDDNHRRLRELIAQVAHRFRRPILLMHGDTHLFRVGRPLAALGLEHLLQVECFGSPFASNWLRIDWDPAAARSGGPAFRVTAQPT